MAEEPDSTIARWSGWDDQETNCCPCINSRRATKWKFAAVQANGKHPRRPVTTRSPEADQRNERTADRDRGSAVLQQIFESSSPEFASLAKVAILLR
jgi:hypothetical protein